MSLLNPNNRSKQLTEEAANRNPNNTKGMFFPSSFERDDFIKVKNDDGLTKECCCFFSAVTCDLFCRRHCKLSRFCGHFGAACS